MMEDYKKHPIWITPKDEMTIEIEVPPQLADPGRAPAPPPPADPPKVDEPKPPASS